MSISTTIDGIRLRIEELSEFEIALREYYVKHGKVCPYDELSGIVEAILQNSELPPHAYSIYNDVLAIFRRLVQRTGAAMADDYMMDSKDDIAILAHPRYCATPLHKHDFYEIAYVYSGTATQTIWAGANKAVVKQRAGAFLIMPPGVSHMILVDDDSVVFNLIMRIQACKQSLLNNLPKGSELEKFFLQTLYSDDPVYLILNTENDEEIRNRFFDIMVAAYDDTPYRRETTNLLASVFFLRLLCRLDTAIDVYKSSMKDVDYIPAIISHIERHYQTVTPGELSIVFGYSQGHMGSFYKRYTGKTLTQTIQSVRLRHAVAHLVETRYKVCEICEMVGYSDITSFIRLFKQIYGQTPHQYRATYQSADGFVTSY